MYSTVYIIHEHTHCFEAKVPLHVQYSVYIIYFQTG